MDTNNTISPDVLAALHGGRAGATTTVSDELGSNFMTLLVTQLQNQNPLKPMENTELTSQLAQINTVSGIDSLNRTLTGITSQIEAGHSLQAVELIGKGVLVPGDRLLLGEEGVTTPVGIELNQPAAEVTVRVMGGDGQLLRTVAAGAMASGVHTISWDGKLESGEFAREGAYRVVVEAADAEGNAIAASTLNYAVVSGISNSKDGLRLDLGGISEQASLADVRQIF